MEGDQYGVGDLRQYMNGPRPLFHGIHQPPQDLCLSPSHPYDVLVFRLDNNNTNNNSSSNHNNNNSASAAATTSIIGHHHHHGSAVHGNNSDGCNNNNAGDLISHRVLVESSTVGDVNNCGNNNNNGRWPRQETLTLLEIRSRLNSKFKEANQKGPLWDDVSRIMSEEHGYQRSGKKCREKFENLYKYYKKTKEGKAGRQDGKHYRFFRQLEALYGEPQSSNSAHFIGGNSNYSFPFNDNTPLAISNQEASQCRNKPSSDISLTFSNCSETDVDSSSEDSDDLNYEATGKQRRRSKKSWKGKIKDFIGAQMKILMDKQESWMENMVKAMEVKEHERTLREEEWRKQEGARIEREHALWAKERAWIEERDTVLMDALHRFGCGNNRDLHQLTRASSDHQEGIHDANSNDDTERKGDTWPPECEKDHVKFQQRLVSSEDGGVLWEEMGNKMVSFGRERSGAMRGDKWDNVVNNYYAIKCGSKKRRDNASSKSPHYYPYNNNNNHGYVVSLSNQASGGGGSSSAEFGGGRNEQKVDDVMRLNEHHSTIIASSPNNTNTNAENGVGDSCFRYLMGDSYGRMMG